MTSLRDSRICSTHPALPCRAFTCRRYAAEFALIVLYILSHKIVFTRSLKPIIGVRGGAGPEAAPSKPSTAGQLKPRAHAGRQ